MSDDVRRIADAVLYEGYLLWPYRRSALKNQRRWTFGGVYPAAHSRAHPDDPSLIRAECLVEGDGDVDVTVRFLHVVAREVRDAEGRSVDELVVGAERHLAWDEAVERELRVAAPAGAAIAVAPGLMEEPLGAGAGALVRRWEGLRGAVAVDEAPAGAQVRRVTVTVENTTPFVGSREDALRRTLCSAHVVLRATGGAAFVSLTDPPDALRKAAAACRNAGVWPVLVGDDTMLASPIILEDHPRIAPESPGDLFDGGEVDELLALNILALTDAEKAEMRASDPRAREILDRTEGLTGEQLLRLHGARR